MIVSSASSMSGPHMPLSRVASIAIGTTPIPSTQSPMKTAPQPQMKNVRRRPFIHSVAPNTYDAKKRATLEKPRVALGMASGRRMNTTAQKEIHVKTESQGSSLELAQTEPKTNTAPISTATTSMTPSRKSPPSTSRVSLTTDVIVYRVRAGSQEFFER
jgi:hypothetical protein